MADKVEELVYLKYFRGLISYRGIQRIETYPVPRAAFREAVLNAIVHRDYSTGNPVHIHIYPDKVLIYNDGRLPETWTVDDLFVPHTSKPYNPLIAGVFFRSGQIEAWGRGVEKITEACRYWDKPDPFYRIRPNEVMIGFHVDSGSIVGINGESVGVNDKSVGVNEKSVGINEKSVGINRKSVGINEEKVGIKETQKHILDLMTQRPEITADQIAESIGVTKRRVESNIRRLKALGVVEHIGARKNGSWVVNLQK
jgi:ATP-dependent DNA helicase RecG